MPESPAPWSPPPELPEHPYRFVPVPRTRARADGWSSDRQHAFVWALACLPSVAKAARGVGMSARSAYRLREAAGAEAFAAAWDDAMEIGIDRARDKAVERAVTGVVVPVVRRGQVIGTQLRFNDRLLAAVLGNVAMEQKGLIAHQRRIAFRRDIRAADERLGGPAGADAIAHGFAEREAAAEADRARRTAEALAALAPVPKRRHAPRDGPSINRL